MRNESHYIECLRDDFGNLEAEVDRLRAELAEARADMEQVIGDAKMQHQVKEIDRLRALNAKLVTACEMFVAWDEDAHSTEVEAGALRRAMSAALAPLSKWSWCAQWRSAPCPSLDCPWVAEAREPQQPPQGLPSDGA